MHGHLEPYLRGGCDALLVFEAESVALRAVTEATRALFGVGADAPFDIEARCRAAPPDDYPSFLEACREAGVGRVVRRGFRFTRQDGKPLWLDLRFRVDLFDDLPVVVATGEQITVSRLAEAAALLSAETEAGVRGATVRGLESDAVAPAGPLAFVPDFGEWKRSAAQLRKRDRMLEIIHDHIGDGVYAVDEASRINFVTPSVERLVGQSRGALLGKTLAESQLFSESTLPQALADLRLVLDGESLAARDYEFALGRGELRVGEVVGSPLRDENDRPLALFVTRDVTKRRREASERANREAQARQSQKLEALGTLAAGFAHEMNNPLTGILNLAELVELELVPADGLVDVARRIKLLCERMTATVRNLVSFASVNSPTTSLVALADVVRATLELIAPRMKRQDITCVVVPTTDGPLLVNAHRGELQQLLLIMLSNACDAIQALGDPPRERRRVEVAMSRVGGFESPALAILLVTDHGTGIAEDVRHRIFDPFFTTKPPNRGGGLGLSVAQGIARDHGGTLDFTTRVGVGTTFRLELPSATRTGDES